MLIGFSVGVLMLFAVMLNNPEKVAEWGSKLFGWQTPKQECINNLDQIEGAMQQWASRGVHRVAGVDHGTDSGRAKGQLPAAADEALSQG